MTISNVIKNNKPGRPSILEERPQVVDIICNAIANGNYQITAAALAGVDQDSIMAWTKLGARDEENGEDTLYSRFYRKLKEAEAKAEAEHVAVIREAAISKREWLPATVFLERRFRERWGRPAPIQITNEDNRQVNITQVEIQLAPGTQPQSTPELTE